MIKYFVVSQIILVFLLSCNDKNRIGKPIKMEEFHIKCMKNVLEENKIGLKYFYKIENKEIREFQITYLGSILTSQNEKLKIVAAINYTGLYEDSKRANGYVFLFDEKNQFLGSYYVGGESDIPTKVDGFDLVFKFNNTSCNQTTRINFKDSIPQQIFIKCTEKGGDLYSFVSSIN